MNWSDLLTVPVPVARAAELLPRRGRCLLVGFGRPGPEQSQALASLVRVCAGSPQGRNGLAEPQFAVVDLARAALGVGSDVMNALGKKKGATLPILRERASQRLRFES